MNIKKHIPNAITSGNLFCGCLALVCILSDRIENGLEFAAYLVGIAAVLDFFDGFAARMLKVHSEIGKQLDSLADMVTFGVVPGAMLFQLMKGTFVTNAFQALTDLLTKAQVTSTPVLPVWTLPLAFLITIFSGIRLAKFNVDTRQTDSFIGVPTPANAMLICSFPLILTYQPVFLGINMQSVIMNPWFLLSLTFIMSYLLVAELPLFALKFKHFKWTGNEIRFIFLLLCLLLLIIFKFVGIPIIIFLYIVLSVINNLLISKKHEVQG
jgi:CDP-diacylglycerol--serine O-phosphatidyltransferase